MKKKLIIIGAGLGGCFLSNALSDIFDVVIVEISDKSPLLKDRVVDTALPARTYPHLHSGFGGTTIVWHNALMEIDAKVFDDKWPFSKIIIAPFYEKAYRYLSGTTQRQISIFSTHLKTSLIEMGFSPDLLQQSMFIPKRRVNAWNTLALQGRVRVVEGEAMELVPNAEGLISSINVRANDNKHYSLPGDFFVLASGGLGSPLLLQKLAQSMPIVSLKNAGRYYEDHPIAFVGEVELNKPLYKLWDFPVMTATGNANIRFPFTIHINNICISFQLRPSYQLRLSRPREKIISALTDLRNFPFRLRHYWVLLTHFDDIFELLSFKFGLHIPTRRYSILMVAEQPPSNYCAVFREQSSEDILRRWEIGEDYIVSLELAIREFLEKIRPLLKSSHLYNDWPKKIYSSSHHSGTARMSLRPEDGVCDMNGQVHGLRNLFVCDGSVIPGSGFVNTGLTIVALALRMGEFLTGLVSKKVV